MRILLSTKYHKLLFIQLAQQNLSIETIAQKIGVTTRTIRNWQSNRNTIPFNSFRILTKIARFEVPENQYSKLETYWYAKKAGSIGGMMRIKKYGNFGTDEGRKKGGVNSIKTHRKRGVGMQTGFQLAKRFQIPKKCERLSEFMGILFGDGHLAHYQVSITTHSVTDIEHAHLIIAMINQLFNVQARLRKKPNKNAVEIVVSSVQLVHHLHSLGMPIGNKIHGKIHVPAWIMKNMKYKRAFIKGLFDTDGCVYSDQHRRGLRTYSYIGWTITSYADKLVRDIMKILIDLGYHPTNRTSQRSVYLRQRDEVRKYFKSIGSHNQKHLKRYEVFNGEVA